MSFYYIGKKRYKSVTTIIGDVLGWNKKVLQSWSNRMVSEGGDPVAYLDMKATFGTRCHKVMEYWALDKEEECLEYLISLGDASKEVTNACNCTILMLEEMGVKPAHVELELISAEVGTGGTADLIARLNDETWILDYKTSKEPRKEHSIQASAYWKLASEAGIKIDRCGVITISETPHFYEVKNIESCYEVFEHLVAIDKLNRKVQPAKEVSFEV